MKIDVSSQLNQSRCDLGLSFPRGANQRSPVVVLSGPHLQHSQVFLEQLIDQLGIVILQSKIEQPDLFSGRLILR